MRAALSTFLVFLAFVQSGANVSDGVITKAEFQKLHTEIVPNKRELWETIPWRIDLLAARTESYKQKKPIFLWAMNGHPLGCT